MAREHGYPAVSVVIPTRNRPQELRRCLAAIVQSAPRTSYEIIVVDDGSTPELNAATLMNEETVTMTLLWSGGIGPAGARNAGINRARGSVIVFTDDDTIPRAGWIDAASAFLMDHPEHVGVTGPTTSPPFDPLYFHSVRCAAPGSMLTCNIAYRRHALQQVGGFAVEFPFPHAEDLDLGIRITKLGPLGFTHEMEVVHPPRPVSLAKQIRAGRMLASDAMLFARHSERYPATKYVSAAGYAFLLNIKRWLFCAVRDVYGVGRNPWRALRFLALGVGYSAQGCVALAARILK